MRNIQHEVLQSLSGLFTTRPAAAHKASQPAAALATCGAFTLAAGRAITLRQPAKAVLRIVRGSAWVTLSSQLGDHFLQAGDVLAVPQYDTVVLEALHTSADSPLYFDLDVVPTARLSWGPVGFGVGRFLDAAIFLATSRARSSTV